MRALYKPNTRRSVLTSCKFHNAITLLCKFQLQFKFEIRAMSSSEATATTTKGGRGKPKASKSVSRSTKAGLQFPVGRVARFLKAGRYSQRVGSGSPVYLSAVLEYLAAEVCKPVAFSSFFLKSVLLCLFLRFGGV